MGRPGLPGGEDPRAGDRPASEAAAAPAKARISGAPWAAASLCLACAAALPLLSAAGIQAQAGPCALLMWIGAALAWQGRRGAALALGLAAASAAAAWGLLLASHGAADWAALPEASRSVAASEALRRLAWGSASSLALLGWTRVGGKSGAVLGLLAAAALAALALGADLPRL